MRDKLPANVKNRRKKTHDKARRLLRGILERCDYKCHYCKCPLIHLEDMPKPYKLHGTFVRWHDCYGLLHTEVYATAEHLKPVRDGGGNENGNVVAACRTCNNARAGRDSWCACGIPKLEKDELCYNCRRKKCEEAPLKKKQLLMDNGWDFWPDTTFVGLCGRWQDPVTGNLKTLDFAHYIQKCRNKYGRNCS